MKVLGKKPCAMCGGSQWPAQPAAVYQLRDTVAPWVLRGWLCRLCARKLGHLDRKERSA